MDMIEHLLLPFTFLALYFQKYLFFFIVIIFISPSIKYKKEKKYLSINEWLSQNNKWVNKQNYNLDKVYEDVSKNIDLYQVFIYIENRTKLWEKSIFKYEQNGKEKYINYNINSIKNKDKSDYSLVLLCLYFYITKQGIQENINDIEIIEKMHDVTVNINIFHRKFDKKNIIEFSKLTIEDKYIYQICYSAIIENINSNQYFQKKENINNLIDYSNDSDNDHSEFVFINS